MKITKKTFSRSLRLGLILASLSIILASVTVVAIGLCSASSVVSVVSYGADPTGVKDSTSAVMAAIAATPSGGTVYFPAGTYKLYPIITLSKPITLEGASTSTTTLEMAPNAVNSTNPNLLTIGSNNVNIQDMTLNCNYEGTSSYGSAIYSNAHDNINIENVNAMDTAWNSIMLLTPTNADIGHCNVINSGMHGIIVSVYYESNSGTNVTVHDCTCENISYYAFYDFGDSFVNFTNCTATNSGKGFVIEGLDNAPAQNVIYTNCNGLNCQLPFDFETSNLPSYTIQNITLINCNALTATGGSWSYYSCGCNNVAYKNCTANANGAYYGWQVLGTNTALTGCTVSNSSVGVALDANNNNATYNGLIQGCYGYNCKYDDFLLANNPSNITVTGNYCWYTTDGGTQIGVSGTNNHVSNNYLFPQGINYPNTPANTPTPTPTPKPTVTPTPTPTPTPKPTVTPTPTPPRHHHWWIFNW